MSTTPNQEIHLYELDLRCPPLPQTMLEAMELSNLSEGPELEQVIEMVQHDPSVVARLLRVVNSAYYGQRGEITNVRRAVLVLGPSSVVGLVMSMGMLEVRAALDANTAGPFLNLVRHSIAVGFLAQQLLLRETPPQEGDSGREQASEGYTAGIMHDFGKLIMLYNFPDKAVDFYTTEQASEQALRTGEADLFGFDHVRTGAYLSQRLNFPERLTKAISCHHECPALEEEAGPTRKLTYAVSAANLAANATGYRFNHEVTWDTLVEQPFWARMAADPVVGYDTPQAVYDVLKSAEPDLRAYVDAVF